MKTVQIPDELYRRAAELAERDEVSVDRLVAALVHERIADVERIQARGARGSLDALKEILSKVPDVPADAADQL